MSTLTIPAPTELSADFHSKLAFLFEPHSYKVLWGGRNGIKSWSIARALLLLGAQRKIRVLCARETQQSISESVHELLRQQIELLGLGGFYDVQKATIVGANGTDFFFVGLKHNINQVRSYEGVDILWVEEANAVSEESWRVVLPTIRKEGSEVWVSFNPELETDATYRRWVLNPPPGAIVVKTSWRDNLWLSEKSRVEIEHMQDTDPAAFDHVYEGNCKSALEGAIFALELAAATQERRITSVPYNRARPVHTAWDLGFGDMTTIWFVQVYDGWFHFIDYLQGQGKTIEHYIIELQNRRYMYGEHWLPHDGVDTIIHRKLAGDRSMSIEQLMRQAGLNVRLAPKLYITDRLNAARTIFPQCRFDGEKCADGVQGLRHYQWGPPTKLGVSKREPLHNWASHPADGFCTAAVAIRAPENEQEERRPSPPPRRGPHSWMA